MIDDVGIDASEVDFRSALWDAGLAFVNYPEGKGGLGVAPGLQAAVERPIREAGRTFNPTALTPSRSGWGFPRS